MKLLRRYIFLEIQGPFLLGLLVFSFVLLIGIIGQPGGRNPLQLLVQNGISFNEALLIFLYLVPRILTLSLPMAVLLAILIGFGRLSADSEVTAMRATGIGTLNLIFPVLLFALVVWTIALCNSLFWYPQSLRSMRKLSSDVAIRSVRTEVHEGVFEEGFSNLVLYVKHTSPDNTIWRNIFVADVSRKDQLVVTLAQQGSLTSDVALKQMQLHLQNGAHHVVSNNNPDVYQVMPFGQIDIPVAGLNFPALNQALKIPVEEMDFASLLNSQTPTAAESLQSAKERRNQMVELSVRLALPCSVIIFALLGLPLGVASRRGGKSYGFVVSLAIFILYYLVFLQGNNFAKNGRLPAFLGPWLANLVFLALGIYLLGITDKQLEWSHLFERISVFGIRMAKYVIRQADHLAWFKRLFERLHESHRHVRLAFLLIIDRYVIKGLLKIFSLVLMAFIAIFVIFTFFELLNDIVENKVPLIVVLEYFLYLLPQILYYMMPLSLLVAVLVNFSLLMRTSQITAIKASGISLYRLSVSVLLVALCLCLLSFLMQELLLPPCNQRQDALRATIKGKTPQTHYHPERKWVMGEDGKIFNYSFFDEDQNLFGDLSIFEFDKNFFSLKRRVYASRASWDPARQSWRLTQGWTQSFQNQHTLPEAFGKFAEARLTEFTEPPQYFKKEVKLDSQMTFHELSAYIQDSKRSGFSVTKLEVALQKKISFPLIGLIMCLLAIPFSFSAGRRGSLYGMGVSILLGIGYWMLVGLFEQVGGVGKLGPELAAWAPNLIFGAAGSYMIFTIET